MYEHQHNVNTAHGCASTLHMLSRYTKYLFINILTFPYNDIGYHFLFYSLQSTTTILNDGQNSKSAPFDTSMIFDDL